MKSFQSPNKQFEQATTHVGSSEQPQTPEEQDQYFVELFNTPPIPFRPRRNNQLDKAIMELLNQWDVTVPIVNIKNNLFLIGCNRVNCDFKFDSILVKVGGGSEKLIEYLYKNQEQMKATLIEQMVKSGKDLDWVVEQLVQGKKIQKKFGSFYNFDTQNPSQFSRQNPKIQKKFGSHFNFDTQNPSQFSPQNLENSGSRQSESPSRYPPKQNSRANSGTLLEQIGYNNQASESPRRKLNQHYAGTPGKVEKSGLYTKLGQSGNESPRRAVPGLNSRAQGREIQQFVSSFKKIQLSDEQKKELKIEELKSQFEEIIHNTKKFTTEQRLTEPMIEQFKSQFEQTMNEAKAVQPIKVQKKSSFLPAQNAFALTNQQIFQPGMQEKDDDYGEEDDDQLDMEEDEYQLEDAKVQKQKIQVTACHSEETKKSLTTYFPGATRGRRVEQMVSEQLKKLGFTSNNTLFADCSCPDEINHNDPLEDITSLFQNRWGEMFPLGGLAGFPFTGKTGWGAFSSHIPVDGNVVIMIAPHVGIDSTGEIGKVLRHGQGCSSSACGAAIGALAACEADPEAGNFKNDFLDHQMDCIKHMLAPHVPSILEKDSKMAALAYKMYELQLQMLDKILDLSKFGPDQKVAIVGGIMINCDGRGNDMFVPMKFELRTKFESEELNFPMKLFTNDKYDDGRK